jgi:hypothetical protein
MRNRLFGAGVATLIVLLVMCWAAGAQEPQAKSSDNTRAQADGTESATVRLTGRVLHRDEAPWSELQVVLVPIDPASGEGSIFYGPSATGSLELGNPNATTDASGSFIITLSRGYVAHYEGTEFRVEYSSISYGRQEWNDLKAKGSSEPLKFKLVAGADTLELGDVW